MPDVSRQAFGVDAAPAAPNTPRVLRGSRCPLTVSKLLLASSHIQVARWDHALRRVEAEQTRILRALVSHAAATEFGRAHGFKNIRRYEDFARLVPLRDYDGFAPYIDRMRSGATGVLVPEKVRYFANSSGSSVQGKGKFLPITERQITEQRRAGADTLLRYIAHARDAEFLAGFTLGLFPPTTMREDGPVLITSNPALMAARMPWLTRAVYLPENDIKRMSDYEVKLNAIAHRYLDWDVRAVAGTTCWFPILLERVRAVAEARGRRSRDIGEIWPNLHVLLGGGVSATPYVPMLRKLVGHDVTLVDTYNATEGGIYAASDHSADPGLLMLPHRGTFFEFVPLGARDRVPLWAVERDRDYSIVVTTLSGLYAYELGDIVRFSSLDPLRIQFVGRLAGCLSITQELTTHVEIERAVAYALNVCGGRTLEFGAAADFAASGAKSRYVLYVEFDGPAVPHDLQEFAAAFDQGLCQQNRVYREHRASDVALLAPQVVVLPRGVAKRFLDRTTSGNLQGKFPRILDPARKQQLLQQLSLVSSD